MGTRSAGCARTRRLGECHCLRRAAAPAQPCCSVSVLQERCKYQLPRLAFSLLSFPLTFFLSLFSIFFPFFFFFLLHHECGTPEIEVALLFVVGFCRDGTNVPKCRCLQGTQQGQTPTPSATHPWPLARMVMIPSPPRSAMKPTSGMESEYTVGRPRPSLPP